MAALSFFFSFFIDSTFFPGMESYANMRRSEGGKENNEEIWKCRDTEEWKEWCTQVSSAAAESGAFVVRD